MKIIVRGNYIIILYGILFIGIFFTKRNTLIINNYENDRKLVFFNRYKNIFIDIFLRNINVLKEIIWYMF